MWQFHMKEGEYYNSNHNNTLIKIIIKQCEEEYYKTLVKI